MMRILDQASITNKPQICTIWCPSSGGGNNIACSRRNVLHRRLRTLQEVSVVQIELRAERDGFVYVGEVVHPVSYPPVRYRNHLFSQWQEEGCGRKRCSRGRRRRRQKNTNAQELLDYENVLESCDDTLYAVRRGCRGQSCCCCCRRCHCYGDRNYILITCIMNIHNTDILKFSFNKKSSIKLLFSYLTMLK